MNEIYTRNILVNVSDSEENASIISVNVAGDDCDNKFCLYLMHGAGSSSYTWHNQVTMLKGHALVIAPDLRSHGLSFNSNDMEMDKLVADSGWDIL